MNIIKFKDQVKSGDDLFNRFLKGKYAWLVGFRYAVPFEVMDEKQYIACENDITNLKYLEKDPHTKPMYWDIYKKNGVGAFIDPEATDSANTIIPFVRANSFSPDDDITMDELRKFRSWLAFNMLTFDQDSRGDQKNQFFDENFTHVLQYYAGGMYDDTVKWLHQFGKTTANITIQGSNSSACGCGNDVSSLYTDVVESCDPLFVYRKSIYNAMVEKFSDIAFWGDFPTIFLQEFKKYIDNILRSGLRLGKMDYVSVFNDCTCISEDVHGKGLEILRSLSTALGYMIEDEVQGNRNFISQAFTDWATTLYEVMEWD